MAENDLEPPRGTALPDEAGGGAADGGGDPATEDGVSGPIPTDTEAAKGGISDDHAGETELQRDHPNGVGSADAAQGGLKSAGTEQTAPSGDLSDGQQSAPQEPTSAENSKPAGAADENRIDATEVPSTADDRAADEGDKDGDPARERAGEKIQASECAFKEEFTRREPLEEAVEAEALKTCGVEACRADSESEGMEVWRKRQRDTETNYLDHELRKKLRKRSIVFERFAQSKQKEGIVGEVDRKPVDIRGKLILAPLTTVGNLPFRRLCKRLGADITVGEMAIAEHLLKAEAKEWALLRRHKSEDVFGVQLAGQNSDIVAKAAELVTTRCDVDFVDLNAGCPIDMVCKKGAGCGLLNRPDRFQQVIRLASKTCGTPFSVKMRTGISTAKGKWNAHKLIPDLKEWGASWVTLHGRSKEQRYRKTADWQYIAECARLARESGIPLVGNGDVFSYEDAEEAAEVSDATMVARGALIKPWVFTEIKESRYIDMTAGQRLELYKEFAGYALDHYGADDRGRETSRRYLLEWLCFACRYPPVGLFEQYGERMRELRPQMNQRIPIAVGRDPLEMTLSSTNPKSWVKISELLLGPVPAGYDFRPKHVSNAWGSEAGMALFK